ncbi:hypothetical protein [Nocardiopsis dassonvillei]|uniref:hypothetical protein n=1 Tax=Nocardiopsis dassonvillei TaxID=2014 RepID=UPI00355622F6
MPRLAPAREVIPAEDVAMVRPYFAAHERLTASAAPRVPAPRFGVVRPAEPVWRTEWAELASLTRAWHDQQRQAAPA